MVFFTCDKCGDSLKKNQVAKHFHNCGSHSFSCMDCQKTFNRSSYNDHLKCISENEKYGGKNYVAKENKGEVKQNAWTECVQKAIDNVKEKRLKELLIHIRGFSNIPRKEAKFINFLVNSFRVRERDLCQKAWKVIDDQVKLQAAEQKPSENGDSRKDAEKIEDKQDCGKSMEPVATNGNHVENGKSEDSMSNSQPNLEFKWKKVIKRKLKSSEDGSMKIKRLRKEVIEEYRMICTETVDESMLKETFSKKLESAGVLIEGNLAKLS